MDFFYTGQAEITKKNAFELLIAADFFDIPPLKNVCIVYLKNNLNISNCCQILQFSHIRGWVDLKETAEKFCLRHFTNIYQTSDFCEMSPDLFLKMFKSDLLCIEDNHIVPSPEEEAVILCNALLAYIEYDFKIE